MPAKAKPSTSREDGAVKRSILAQVHTELTKAHADEFHARMAELYADKGWTYVPPLSPEEKAKIKEDERLAKAQATLDALLAAHPNLVVKPKPPTPTATG